jgi:glycosyltransferase involved in cell wall biosynthesis
MNEVVDPPCEKLGDIAAEAGLRSIHILAWRDLDDPEAGGSEVHASTIARLWAKAGIDVTIRTSSALGHPAYGRRDGYRVIRKAGRYMVFPRSALSGLVGRTGQRDGLVEVWNGMPFFSPLWVREPRIVWLHHVHAEQWGMTLPPWMARIGKMIEFRLAPPVYRSSQIVTLSESSKSELVNELRLRAEHITVVPPGIDPRFSPSGPKAPTPLVVAVGRLVPVKRFHILMDALARLKSTYPALEAVIVGEGYERPALESRRASLAADSWIHLPGHLSDAELVELYRRAWVLAATSAREGWGMAITEAGACGTPSVVTRIAGHSDAVVQSHSGFLVDGEDDLVAHLDKVLSDEALRESLGKGARQNAERFTWFATAKGTLEVLAAEALRRRHSRRQG